jgi:hypothetical protein
MLGLAIGCKPSFGMGVSHWNNLVAHIDSMF